MTNYYVRSTDGSDSDNGLSWANAKATLVGAAAVAVAGDTVFVSQNHAESQASAMTVTWAGTAAAPVNVLCVNDAAEPPTALASTATVTVTGNNAMALAGGFYSVGIDYIVGSGGGSASSLTVSGLMCIIEDGLLKLLSSNSSPRITFGINSTANSYVELRNAAVQFANISQSINCTRGTVLIDGLTVLGATLPTTLFAPMLGGKVICKDSDLSPITGSLVDVSSGNRNEAVLMNNKLAGGVAGKTGTIVNPNSMTLKLHNCDSGNTNYRAEEYYYQGSTLTETTIVRTGGASDGVTPLSHKMASLATGPNFTLPLPGIQIAKRVDSVGSALTATVEILHDSVTALTDAEVWLEVEYLGTSGFPLGVLLRDRAANILAAAANQPSSSVTWTTTGLTNPHKQKLEVTFTPQQKGVILARVMLAKPNYTLYVDPLLSVA